MPSSVEQTKKTKFLENMINKLQGAKHYRSSQTEGYIQKFSKKKYVQPGQDLFLGFLKYMSSTAFDIQQKIITDQNNQLAVSK